MNEENNGPDFFDGTDEEGFEGGDDRMAADAEDAGFTAGADEEGYLVLPETEADEVMVIVQDFDPADPGAEIAEPQVVSTREHRTSRQIRKDRNSGR